MRKPKSPWLVLILVPLLLPLLLGGCSSRHTSAAAGDLKMASMDGMPNEVKTAPILVQQAYRFAAANPEVMTQIPCYCGCGAMGHTSNYACYIGGKNDDGTLKYDTHALGCSICVDITQDTMRMLREGKSVQEIRAYIDSAYSKYGPSNIP